MGSQVYVRTFFFGLDNFDCSWLPNHRMGQRHPNAVAQKMTVNNLKVCQRAQRAEVDLLTARSIRAARQRLNVSGKIFDPFDLVVRQEDGAKLREIQPLIRGVLYAAGVEIERVDIGIGLHRRVPKKQGPLPQERPRALLPKQ